MLQVYNTLSRKKEEFQPLKPGHVGFYSCGPTVYWYQHIGNLRTYIFNDILKRILEYNNLKVKHVMNYTDVGHLTSDADQGEDKMELAAKREHKSAAEIAQHYIDVFEKDCQKLNIIPPQIRCKATEHIQEQIKMVQELEKQGYTYNTNDGVYFDTAKMPEYGALDPAHKQNLEAGKRIDMGDKHNPTDFALWKFSETPGKRQQEWPSPWGIGFPGWHIECSAMSSKYLGQQFDIHTGGEDHVQIHHTNEIAQSECCFHKKPWVRYWLHGAFLMSKGEKVSKSKGGLFTVSELEEQKFEPLSYRYLCLSAHYRKPLNFSLEVLGNAQQSYQRLKRLILELKSKQDSKEAENNYAAQFLNAINDDLNMPMALSVIWEVLRDQNLGSKQKLELLYRFDDVLGLGLKDIKAESLNEDIDNLVQQREQARKNKDFKEADRIRDLLKEKGIILRDTKEGVKWEKS